jgi:hypothetical protein
VSHPTEDSPASPAHKLDCKEGTSVIQSPSSPFASAVEKHVGPHTRVGLLDGLSVGAVVGSVVGSSVGKVVGRSVGAVEGLRVGACRHDSTHAQVGSTNGLAASLHLGHKRERPTSVG